jgi:hypothetical protein
LHTDELAVLDLDEHMTRRRLPTREIDGSEHAVGVELVDAVERLEQVLAGQTVLAVGLDRGVGCLAEGLTGGP